MTRESTPTVSKDPATNALAGRIRFGMTLSSEEHPPVPNVWPAVGAIAARTDDIHLGIGVTCPIMRVHPAVVAHAAATVGCLADGRFTLGVGTGEALNEHITGQRWPPADVRLAMLDEAITVIRELWDGGSVTHRGSHYTVENATLYDLPQRPIPLVVSAFGPRAARLAAERGDGLWITGTDEDTVAEWRNAGGSGPVWTQLTFCLAPGADEARRIAARQWPNTAVVGQLSQDLPTTAHFTQASSHVTEDNIAEHVPCGPDIEPILEAVDAAASAGATHIYLHQIGDDQQFFLDQWSGHIRPALAQRTVSDPQPAGR